jgi:D-tyrosyl-tRNA(Tyr) deacylase
MAERVLNYRVFPDDQQRMNCSLLDVGGGILLISQFTLAADTKRGNRPGFSTALPAEQAQDMFAQFVESVNSLALPSGVSVACGKFQADMQVSSINDGPINFLLEVTP